jgi:hypothetical protein
MTIEEIWSLSFATSSERGSGGIAVLSGRRVRGSLPGFGFDGEFDLDDAGTLNVEAAVWAEASNRRPQCRLVLRGRYDRRLIELSGFFVPRSSRAATVLLHDRKELVELPMLASTAIATRYQRWGSLELRG